MMNKSLLYISDTGLMMLVILYLPLCLLALWLIGVLLRDLGCPLRASRWVRGLLALAMLLWPTWDAIPGKYYLDRYCEQGGVYAEPGLKIDGIYFPFKGSEKFAKGYLDRGLKYIETDSESGSIIRFEVNENGKITREIVDEKGSIYISDSENPNMRIKPEFINITMKHHYLMNIESKKRVAGYKNYTFQSRFDSNFTILDVYPAISCNDIAKFKMQKRFQKPSEYISLVVGREG